MAILNEDQIKRVLELLDQGQSRSDIAKMFGVYQSTIAYYDSRVRGAEAKEILPEGLEERVKLWSKACGGSTDVGNTMRLAKRYGLEHVVPGRSSERSSPRRKLSSSTS